MCCNFSPLPIKLFDGNFDQNFFLHKTKHKFASFQEAFGFISNCIIFQQTEAFYKIAIHDIVTT